MSSIVTGIPFDKRNYRDINTDMNDLKISQALKYIQ